jgi:hypothetical protein
VLPSRAQTDPLRFEPGTTIAEKGNELSWYDWLPAGEETWRYLKAENKSTGGTIAVQGAKFASIEGQRLDEANSRRREDPHNGGHHH